MNDVTEMTRVTLKLAEAEALITDLIAALEPFAKKAKAFDWRRGQTYRTFNNEPFSDDEAKVMLDTIEVAKAKPNQLSIGHFRRAREVYARAAHGRSS